MDAKVKEECLKAIIKKAHKSTIQSCVNLRNPLSLAYAYSNVIEEYFTVKKGTSSFGVVASDLFRDFYVDSVKMEEIKKQIRFHKYRYKHSISPDLKKHHLEEHNKLVDIERELYKPIRKFVKMCNKFRSVNIA